MFSVTKTGMNFRPLWTAKVKPTMSGMMVDRLDQVLMTFLSPSPTALRNFRARLSSTYGPFLIDRATEDTPCSVISDALRCRGRKPCSCGSCAPWSAFPTACRDASPRRISPPPRRAGGPPGSSPRRVPSASGRARGSRPPAPGAKGASPPPLRENRDDVPRCPCQLPPLAHLELHVVDHRPDSREGG